MAGTFTTTGTYSNLTRLELEQLRKSDFFAGGKALTVGDSALAPEGVVGPGSINAEPYTTLPVVDLGDVYSTKLPANPGNFLELTTKIFSNGPVAETAMWYGPTIRAVGGGVALTANSFEDPNADFITAGILVGDYVLFRLSPDSTLNENKYAVGSVSAVTNATELALSNIVAPFSTPTTDLTVDNEEYPYVIIRPSVVQLFAIPGSGPLGREQSFLMVSPNFPSHGDLSPLATTIASNRIQNLVPPSFGADASVDRADAVFGPPNTSGPRLPLNNLGYRVVLYKSNNTGTGADLTAPIASLNPVIDSTIPAADQRMTIDYKAGIVRFSVAPRAGDDIKPTGGNGGVNPSTGRLQLYAVFWAVDKTLTNRSAANLFQSRTTTEAFWEPLAPAQVLFQDGTWKIGSTPYGNDLTVRADETGGTDFGAAYSAEVSTTLHGLRVSRTPIYSGVMSNPSSNIVDLPVREAGIRIGDILVSGSKAWAIINIDYPASTVTLESTTIGPGWAIDGSFYVFRSGPSVNLLSTSSDGIAGVSAPVQERTSVTVSTEDNASTEYPFGVLNYPKTLTQALQDVSFSGTGVVHLKRGVFRNVSGSGQGTPVYIPPGVVLEGEGPGTRVVGTTLGAFKFGANTSWGVYDPTWDGATTHPTTWDYADGVSTSNHVEGYEVVWNSTKKSWVVIVADATTNQIWLNEMRPDGSTVFVGTKGIDIKNSADPLYTNETTSNFTPGHVAGHYPRAAFNESRNEYVVVWVEDALPGSGGYPLVRYAIVNALSYQVTFTGTCSDTGNGTTTTPSVATHGSYAIITCTNYGGPAPTLTSRLRVYKLQLSNGNLTSVGVKEGLTGSPARGQIGSTDVVWSGIQNAFVAAFSYRRHSIESGSGTMASGTLTDGTVSDWVDPTTGLNVGSGSRFLDMTNGRTGVVVTASSGSITVNYDKYSAPGGINYPADGPINYAIAPVGRIWAFCVDADTNTMTDSKMVAGHTGLDMEAFATIYYDEEREPDFVRLSKGPDGKIIAVYQNFDTTAAHRAQPANWDNGFDLQYLDFPHANTGSWAAREHIGTSFNLLNVFFSPVSGNFQLNVQDRSLLDRSMGSREPMHPYPNVLNNTYRPYNEVAPAFYFMDLGYRGIMGANQYKSLIPDVTWNGEDWVAVTPTVSGFHSYTGAYVLFGGQHFLVDPMFLFGQDGVGSVSSTTRGFLPYTYGAGTRVYFPNHGNFATMVSPHSEHVVRLLTPPTGAISGDLIEYHIGDVHSSGNADPRYGIKSPGFRISVDGEMIVSSTYTTHALDTDSAFGTLYDRKQEVLNRNLLGEVGLQNSRYFNLMQSHQWNDLLEGYRMSAHLGFQGVCVGAPKRIGSLLQTPEEATGYVALAWGDNYYCALDMEKWGFAGSGGLQKQVRAYRQSFGPWRSGLRDMAIESGASILNVSEVNRKHVLTRHGGMGNPSHFFGTDGFRNAFLQWGVQSFFANHGPNPYGGSGGDPLYSMVDTPDPRFVDAWFTSVCAVFTDAEGRNPVRKRLRVQNALMPRNAIGVSGGYLNLVNPTHTGKVVWTGSQFLGVLAAENRIYIFDLGVDDRTEGEELTGVRANINTYNQYQNDWANLVGYVNLDWNIGGPNVQNPSGSAVITNNKQVRDALTFDVAWSGKKLAIVWRVGSLNYVNTSLNSGAAVGITFLTSLEPIGQLTNTFTGYINEPDGVNVASYILATNTTPVTISSPRLTWDGKNFVACAKINTAFHLFRVPEEGYRSNSSVSLNSGLNFSGVGGANYLGTITSDGKLDMSATYMNVKVGDIVTISRTSQAAPNAGNSFADAQFANNNGSFRVVAIFGGTNIVQLNTNLVADSSSSGFRVYGTVTTGDGVLPPLVSGFAPVHASGTLRGSTALMRPAGTVDTLAIPTSNNIVLGIFPLEKKGGCVLFTTDSGLSGVELTAIVISPNWTYQKVVTYNFVSTYSGYGIRSIDFNGSHFALLLNSQIVNVGTNAGIVVFMDLDFNIVHEVMLSNPIGGGNSSSFYASKPGVGYGAINSASDLSYAARFGYVKWNPVSARWMVSISFQAGDINTAPYLLSSEVSSFSETLPDIDTFTNWTTRSLNFSTATIGIQTGVRYLTYRASNRVTSAGSLPTDNTDGQPPVGTRAYSIHSVDPDWVYTNGMIISVPTATGELLSTTQKDDLVTIQYTGATGATTGFYRCTKAGTAFGGIEHAYVSGSIIPQPTGNTTVFVSYTAPNAYADFYLFHVVSGDTTAPKNVFISTHVNERSSPLPVSNDFYAVPREDVFLWTLSHEAHPVIVESADQVFVENVDFMGHGDISLRSRNFSRPFWKVTGAIVARPNDNPVDSIHQGPKALHVHPTPVGKVRNLRLTNVRSTAIGRYGQKALTEKGE
jgi:hypothetical protein